MIAKRGDPAEASTSSLRNNSATFGSTAHDHPHQQRMSRHLQDVEAFDEDVFLNRQHVWITLAHLGRDEKARTEPGQRRGFETRSAEREMRVVHAVRVDDGQLLRQLENCRSA